MIAPILAEASGAVDDLDDSGNHPLLVNQSPGNSPESKKGGEEETKSQNRGRRVPGKRYLKQGGDEVSQYPTGQEHEKRQSIQVGRESKNFPVGKRKNYPVAFPCTYRIHYFQAIGLGGDTTDAGMGAVGTIGRLINLNPGPITGCLQNNRFLFRHGSVHFQGNCGNRHYN